MTPEEKTLLLTVARILRARLPELAVAYQDDDLAALNEALAPFDPSDAPPVNEATDPGRPLPPHGSGP